jgi:hypothetical protein
VNINIGGSKNNRQPLNTIDFTTLDERAEAYLDLEISQRLLDTFDRSIIKQCWMDQLQFECNNKNSMLSHIQILIHLGDDVNLYLACTILQRQKKYLGNDESNIIVPKNVSEQRHQLLVNNSKQTYSGKTRFCLQSISKF